MLDYPKSLILSFFISTCIWAIIFKICYYLDSYTLGSNLTAAINIFMVLLVIISVLLPIWVLLDKTEFDFLGVKYKERQYQLWKAEDELYKKLHDSKETWVVKNVLRTIKEDILKLV